MSRKAKKKPPDSHDRPQNLSRPTDVPHLHGDVAVGPGEGPDFRPVKMRLCSSPRSRYAISAVCGLLLLAVALIFGKTVLYDFVNFDDDVLVYENPIVARGVTAQGIAWAFTANVANMWYPLTLISYMLDSQMYGLKPWGYHLTNVLLHAATTVILFLALRRMTGNLWASAFATLLFAVHPLRAEAVAWVGERKSPLSGLFFVSTIAAYVAYARRPFSLARYLAVAGLFTLGLLAKPTMVTLPFLLLLLDYWPLGRWPVAMPGARAGARTIRGPTAHRSCWLVLEKFPFLLLSVACSVAAVLSSGRQYCVAGKRADSRAGSPMP